MADSTLLLFHRQNEAPGQYFFISTPIPNHSTHRTNDDMTKDNIWHASGISCGSRFSQQQPSLIPPLSQYKILNCLLVNYLSSLLCLVCLVNCTFGTVVKKSERKNDFNCNALSNCTTWNNLSVQQVVQKCPLMRQMKWSKLNETDEKGLKWGF